jgi:hypothetical protein
MARQATESELKIARVAKPKKMVFWIPSVQRNPLGVCSEKQWHRKDLYSGEMQLLQKDFEMEKTLWMFFGQAKHTQNTGKHTSH